MKEVKSFKMALKGIIYSICNERHMRFHMISAIYVLFFSMFFELSGERLAILLLTIFIVIFSELINTVVEKMSDLLTGDYNPIIKVVKDIAAGSVLIAGFCAILVAFCLFNDIDGYLRIYDYFLNNYVSFLFFLVSVILSLKFVKYGPNEFKYKLIKIKNMFTTWLEKLLKK